MTKIALLQRNKSMEGSHQLQLGDSHFKKPIVFSFASWDVAIFLAALYELHTHFVLSELDQKLIRNLNVELLLGLAESSAVKFSGHFNKVIAAEQEIPFASCS